jgi:hypothetical protein
MIILGLYQQPRWLTPDGQRAVLGRTSGDTASRTVSTVSIVSRDLPGWCGRVHFPPINGRC